jgi:hypothetical protein
MPKEPCMAWVGLPRTTGVEGGEVQEPNEMATNPNTKKVPTDEAYYVSAADLADKIIFLMQQGLNPLQLSGPCRFSPTRIRVDAN